MSVATPKLDPVVLVEALATLWPKAFTTDPRERHPLKVGIFHDIEAACAGTLTKLEISVAMRWYTSGGSYLWRLKTGATRIDLQGQPAGTVTEEEAKHAKARLAARKVRHRKQKAVSGGAAPPPETDLRPLHTGGNA